MGERLDRRLDFLEFASDDAHRLRALGARLAEHDDVFTARFYEHLLSYEHLRGLLADASTFERLRRAQSDYFRRLLAGHYDDDYARDRTKVGEAHHRVGLEPEWYMGAYALYLRLLLPSVCPSATEAERHDLESLLKVVFLDLGLALDTYLAARERERDLAVEAGRKSDALLRLFAENARDVIYRYRVSEPHGVEYVSPSVFALYGYTQDECYADPSLLLRIAHPDDLRLFEARLQRPELSESPQRLRAIRKDGRQIWVEASAHAVLDAQGRFIAIEGILRDQTDRVHAEEQLRHGQKMEVLGQLAGAVAHDFNNVLTVVRSYCSLLCEELPEGDARREDVLEIARASSRAEGFTRQLLSFTRREVVAPRVVDLNALVLDTERMLRRLIGAEVQIRLLLAPSVLPVCVDPGQLEQVLVNLVVNARDAMPHGGEVRIGTGTHATEAGCDVTLTVSDDGCGIDEATRSRIFEPFFTTKAHGVGTGLGLATVHGIVAQSGGRIVLASEPGRGATFTVLLPRSTETPVDLRDARTLAARMSGTETILVAEDDVAIRRLLRRVLEDQGYSVLTVRSSKEAIALFQASVQRIDLLVSDIVMPEFDGFETFAKLREIDDAVRVVFMTGYTNDARLMRRSQEDEASVLFKPFTPDELLTKVRTVLDRR